MSAIMTAATFAYRITSEGAEKVEKAVKDIGKTARSEFNGAAKSTREFNKDLRDTIDRLNKLEGAANGFKTIRNAVLTLAGAGGIAYLIKSSLEAADNIGDMAEQAGYGVEQFQELEYALRKYSVSQENAVAGMRELNVRSVEFVRDNSGAAKTAFERLGFGRGDVEEGLKNADRFFEIVLGRISTLDSEAEKIDISRRIFGKAAGAEMVSAANAGTDAIRAARQEARDLNYVIGQELVQSSADAHEKIEILGDVLKRQLVIAVAQNADEIERFMKVMIEGFPRAIELATILAEKIGLIAPSVESRLDSIYGAQAGALDRMSNVQGYLGGEDGLFGGISERQYDLIKGSRRERFDLESQMMAEAMEKRARDARTKEYLDQFDSQFSGGSVKGGSELSDRFNEEREANQKLIESLQFEVEVLKLSEREQAIARATRKLSADATAEQRDNVKQLAGALYDEQERVKKLLELEKEQIKKKEELKREARDFANSMAEGFEEAIASGKKFADVLDELLEYITKFAIRKSFTDPLTDLLSGVFDGLDLGSALSFSSTPAPARAAGGTVYAGELYRVNERQNIVEGFRPNSGGQIIPLGVGNGGGVNVTIINNTPAQVSAQSQKGGDGMDSLLVQIDDVMAGNVNNPFSKTNQALRQFSQMPTVRR